MQFCYRSLDHNRKTWLIQVFKHCFYTFAFNTQNNAVLLQPLTTCFLPLTDPKGFLPEFFFPRLHAQQGAHLPSNFQHKEALGSRHLKAWLLYLVTAGDALSSAAPAERGGTEQQFVPGHTESFGNAQSSTCFPSLSAALTIEPPFFYIKYLNYSDFQGKGICSNLKTV